MSNINIQKLGLPTHPRTLEIIEEDYPAISLANRMKLINKQFAERQSDEKRDFSKPPEDVAETKYQFDVQFNELLGLLKRLASSNVEFLEVGQLHDVLSRYTRLAIFYEAYVRPKLFNELFRREIYLKLDQLANVSGQLASGLVDGSKVVGDTIARTMLNDSYINRRINEHDTLYQMNQQGATFEDVFRYRRSVADEERRRNDEYRRRSERALTVLVDLFEKIRRDALTRILRPVSFDTENPLPGQVRNYEEPEEDYAEARMIEQRYQRRPFSARLVNVSEVPAESRRTSETSSTSLDDSQSHQSQYTYETFDDPGSYVEPGRAEFIDKPPADEEDDEFGSPPGPASAPGPASELTSDRGFFEGAPQLDEPTRPAAMADSSVSEATSSSSSASASAPSTGSTKQTQINKDMENVERAVDAHLKTLNPTNQNKIKSQYKIGSLGWLGPMNDQFKNLLNYLVRNQKITKASAGRIKKAIYPK